MVVKGTQWDDIKSLFGGLLIFMVMSVAVAMVLLVMLSLPLIWSRIRRIAV